MTKDPWDIPEWHFVKQEAQLVRHLLGSGATSLGRANYADKKGEYYTAFFALSVGLERLCKLILVIDHALENNGRMPPQDIVRRFGHQLEKLVDAVAVAAARRSSGLPCNRPVDAIVSAIISNFDAFADARRGRYANFEALGDPNLTSHEPVSKWWNEVAEPILDRHYKGTKAQSRIELNARLIDRLIGDYSLVRHISETRELMTDVETASTRTGQTAIVQKWARYYTLTLIRWLSETYKAMAYKAVYDEGYDAFFGSWEFFDTFLVDDNFLRTRKVWPLDS
ncbi:hypothetical protein [Rhizobium miluonense]|uniref:HEPN AbiU2-like domain-containing protein n=1 Tax=Rhizobium miluonense TaxID=411945 RepID=A0ABU1SR94_9HYPH|nr:hypothetical protein [Rhizobium miluonense]MDR6901487.1 hypothetical protein [Rhizobium miluonense]